MREFLRDYEDRVYIVNTDKTGNREKGKQGKG